MTSWRPTEAHVRAWLVAAGAALLAVLVQRPDLLVVAAPFALAAAMGHLGRPTEPVDHASTVTPRRAPEGATVRFSVTASTPEGSELLSVGVLPDSRPFYIYGPASAVTSTQVDPGGETSAAVAVRSMLWGQRWIGPGVFQLSSGWGAWQWGPVELPKRSVMTLPVPEVFTASAGAPHPDGLIGSHRGVRAGDGSEFSGIRPFATGDRLRHIHWARSLRTGTLHVTTTYAEQDTHVALLMDADGSLGTSEGIHGKSSSLDLGCRAAGALAKHFLGTGDRVSLRIMGAVTDPLPPRSGRRHLDRVLTTLALCRSQITSSSPAAWGHVQVGAGALVVVLSPLVSDKVLTQAAVLARRGLSVVVIDTAPSQTDAGDDEIHEIAWRIRMLERQREIQAIQQMGVPVVKWAGPGSLDEVLRQMSRRGRAVSA